MSDFDTLCKQLEQMDSATFADIFAKKSDDVINSLSECAFVKGKNCYHPDMQVPSVSGYGIDMTSYMKEIGIEFSFSKDSVTLYGVLLFK